MKTIVVKGKTQMAVLRIFDWWKTSVPLKNKYVSKYSLLGGEVGSISQSFGIFTFGSLQKTLWETPVERTNFMKLIENI